MSTYETIFKQIESWNLSSARELLSQLPEISDGEFSLLDKMCREYEDVDVCIKSLRYDLKDGPAVVLVGLDKLPDIKSTHPDYQNLLDAAKEGSDTLERKRIVERIKKAEELSGFAKHFEEAKVELQAIRDSFPNWASDLQINNELHRVENEAIRAEKASILMAGIQQDILLGKPDEGLQLLGELQFLDKIPLDEIEKLRKELNREVAHKHFRSSKDNGEFSSGEDPINKVERSVSSIENTAGIKYRLLFNNRYLQHKLYRDAMGKERERRANLVKQKKDFEAAFETEMDEEKKADIDVEISTFDKSIAEIDARIGELEDKVKTVNQLLPGLQIEAIKQINLTVDEALEDAGKYFEGGQLSMALLTIQTAQNAGKAETYDEEGLDDYLGSIPLNVDQVKLLETLQSKITIKQELRRTSIARMEAVQKKLSDPFLTILQLKELLIDLKNIREADKDVPGLSSAFAYIEERIDNETSIQIGQSKLRIDLLCQKGLVEEARRIYDHALRLLEDNDEIKSLHGLIKTTQQKVLDIERISQEFQMLFATTRENLSNPDQKLRDLLKVWSEEGFDTLRSKAANARFEQYISGLSVVKQIFNQLKKDLNSGVSPAELQPLADELRQSFLSRESAIQELLANYWLALASQYRDKDPLKEEELLQEALENAENSKNNSLISKIKSRLKEIQNLTELGRKARRLEEDLIRYRERDFQRALEKIALLDDNDPIRQYPRIAHLIDDIEYEDKNKRAAEFFRKAKEYFSNGEYASAKTIVEQVLEILPNYFEAVQLKGDIAVARANEEPIIEKINQLMGMEANTENFLNNEQVRAIEETKIIVDQLDSKPRISLGLLTLKKQFKIYFDGWYSRMRNVVDSSIDSAKLEADSGNFDKADNILIGAREKGIPSDLLAIVSDAENQFKTLRSKTETVNRLLKQADETAQEGSKGIVDAISILTPLRGKEIVPLHLELIINNRLAEIKKAQNDFGKIATEITEDCVPKLAELLNRENKNRGFVDLDPLIIEGNRLLAELRGKSGKLKGIGIKDNNLVFKSVSVLQDIAFWYVNSIEFLNHDRLSEKYLEAVETIKTFKQSAVTLKSALPQDFPQSQIIESAIDNHINLLEKIRQNNDIFAEVNKTISTYGAIGWPNKGYWQSLLTKLNDVLEKTHCKADVIDKEHLAFRVDQKQKEVIRTWLILAVPSGLVLLAVIIGLVYSAWRGYVGPTYFPTPTPTLTPTITPTITPTGTVTPIPSITPRSTVTPTPTPLPVLVRVIWRDGAVFIAPDVLNRIYTFDYNKEINIQAYCISDNLNFWGKVDVPNDYRYGWIRMAEFNGKTSAYYDFVNADLAAGLRAESVFTIMSAHPELLISCP